MPIGEALNCDPNVIVKTFDQGDYFCEYSLFLAAEAKHPFTVRARNTTELFTMNRKALQYLAEHFPPVESAFLNLCEKRFAELMAVLASPYNMTLVQKPEDPAQALNAADSRNFRRGATWRRLKKPKERPTIRHRFSQMIKRPAHKVAAADDAKEEDGDNAGGDGSPSTEDGMI